jgi:hypothetical protein
MAIAKVGSTGSSAGAINYVLSEKKDATKQPEILAGSFGTMAEIKQEFEFYNKLNSRVKNQAAHISVSFSPEERVKTEKKIELAEKLLEKLDFKNVPFLVVEHHDKDYEHFHIIAGRIRDDGTTVKEWEIAERAIKATKELEIELGLKQVEYIKSGDRRVKIGEYKQMERTNDLSVMAEAKLTIDEILANQPTTEEFVLSLQRSGFEVRPNISEKTGRMNGFSFKKGGIAFKSSAIAKNYSWQNLQKNGLNYKHERDTEFLIGVKNEFTEKLNLESGRDRADETPKSVVNSAESIIERAKSVFGEGTRSAITETEDRTSGHTNLLAEPESVEIHNDSSVLAFTEKSDGAKISNEAVFENGHGQKSQGNGSNARENSAVGESKDGFTSSDVSFSAPKLNPAPNREADKTNSHSRQQEIIYDKGRSR